MTLQAIIFSFISALLGSMGFGGGTVLIIYLTSLAGLSQLQAQGINLLFFIPCAAVASFIYFRRRLIEKKLLLPLISSGAAGVFSGLFLLKFIDPSLLSRFFGGFLVIIALKSFFSKKK